MFVNKQRVIGTPVNGIDGSKNIYAFNDAFVE